MPNEWRDLQTLLPQQQRLSREWKGLTLGTEAIAHYGNSQLRRLKTQLKVEAGHTPSKEQLTEWRTTPNLAP